MIPFSRLRSVVIMSSRGRFHLPLLIAPVVSPISPNTFGIHLIYSHVAKAGVLDEHHECFCSDFGRLATSLAVLDLYRHTSLVPSATQDITVLDTM